MTDPDTDPRTYGDSFADVYDDWYGTVTDAVATARFVAACRGPGPVLELGVGTGRLARPLVAEGVPVIGLDASAPMLRGCVDPARGTALPVVQADMAALPFRGPFGAILIAFNTLFNLGSADAQRSLFAEMAAVLDPGGAIVVEVMDTVALVDGPRRSVALSRHHDDGVTVVGTNLDPEGQTILGQHLEVRADGVRRRPWFLRWSSVEEIDAYAAAAGLRCAERRAGWEDGAADTGTHVLVYRPGSPSTSDRPLL